MSIFSSLFEDLFSSDVDLDVDTDIDVELSEQIEFDPKLGEFVDERNEMQALFAFDRMSHEIDADSYADIKDYFESNDFSPEQFKGVLSNWKGHFGEVEVVQKLTEQGDGSIEYCIPTDTTNPDVDIYGINDKGEIVEKYQVKMSLDKGYINRSLDELPDDVKLICPTEIAGDYENDAVVDVGLSAIEIEGIIESICTVLMENEPWEQQLEPEFYTWVQQANIKGH